MKTIAAILLACFVASLCGAAEPGTPLTAEDIPARIAVAEVGEWALYKTERGRRSRLTVVEKWTVGKDTFLIIAVETLDVKGRRIRVREEQVSVSETLASMRNLGPEDTVVAREVLVHGRTLDTVVVSQIDQGVVYRQSYFSDEIPVYGLVRGVNPQAKKSKLAMNLMDYGFADDGEE